MNTHRLLTVVLFVLFSSSANALLISADLNTTGDSLLTLDTRTGLEWLDAPLSVGRSYNDLVGIDGTDEFAAGGDFAGFRLASTDEVRDLFVNSLEIPLTDFAQWRASSYDRVIFLHSLFGTTSGGDFAEIRSITADMRTASSHWQSFARICQNGLAAVCSDFNTANVNVNGTSASDAYGGSTTGAWIVRESIASVPEPGSLALLGIGLVAFGLFQKKRTS